MPRMPVLSNGEEEDAFFSDPRFAWKIDKKLAQRLGLEEIGFFVEEYYELQECRMRANSRVKALQKQGEPSELMAVYGDQYALLESRTKSVLEAWCSADELASWAMKVRGIGPVIAAGLCANIRAEKAPHASSVFRFAGLDPSAEWAGKEGARAVVDEALATTKGDLEAAVFLIAKRIGFRPETLRRFAATGKDGSPRRLTKDNLRAAAARRPWNDKLKVIAWKIGQQFVKLGDRYPESVYAKIYRAEKARIMEANARGDYKACAEATLKERTFRESETKKAYEAGMLPDGRVELRAERKATKIFLAHFWTKARKVKGLPISRPWVIEHGGHSDEIPPEVPY